MIWSVARGRLLNLQRLRVTEVGEKHYDIGNDLYAAMLDRRMIYSCGYWKDADDLDAAQEAKLDLICRKIGLAPGMRILDIGSGWGGFLQFAAERYGVSGVGVTVSKEQAALANERTRACRSRRGCSTIRRSRGNSTASSRSACSSMSATRITAPISRRLPACWRQTACCCCTRSAATHSTTHGDPWSEKYIFPNGMLPSIAQIGKAIEGLFVMEDWHNFGADYDRTLMAWRDRFDAAWPQLSASYDERFYRMWRYYLSVFAALFRARNISLWQVVLSPRGVPGGYTSIR